VPGNLIMWRTAPKLLSRALVLSVDDHYGYVNIHLLTFGSVIYHDALPPSMIFEVIC
jgi:hypothetical protein